MSSSEPQPILIWGAGAIGGILGAYWARAGIPVLMVDIVEDHVRACRTTGLNLTGPVEAFRQVVPSVTPAELTGRYSTTVLAVKAQATDSAMQMLAPHLADDGFVLSAQNGLNELAIARVVGNERTMGCFVNYGADWLGPGEILFGNRAAVVVGEIDDSVRERTRRMHELLSVFEPNAVLTDNIWGYLWGKLAYGAMLFATALTQDSMSDNFADPRRFIVFDALAREVMAVAAARKVTPVGFNGFDPACFAPGAPEQGARASIAALISLRRTPHRPDPATPAAREHPEAKAGGPTALLRHARVGGRWSEVKGGGREAGGHERKRPPALACRPQSVARSEQTPHLLRLVTGQDPLNFATQSTPGTWSADARDGFVIGSSGQRLSAGDQAAVVLCSANVPRPRGLLLYFAAQNTPPT